MKLIRFGDPGRERPGIQLADGTCVDVSNFVRDYDESFFACDGLAQLQDWFRLGRTSALPVPHFVRLGSPICRPSKIICTGLNFRDHAEESGMAIPQGTNHFP